ncbi:MAG TPA: lactonase family protein [Acidobacteriaceae bacterium]|nr:lactonase family protein [Acidobacteriaceae bacterium]
MRHANSLTSRWFCARRICAISGLLLLAPLTLAAGSSPARNFLIYVGTLGGSARGIYAYRFNATTGAATFLGLAAQTTSPSFLVAGHTRRVLYAVNEIRDQQGSGRVSAFRIDPEGKLVLIDSVSSGGANPCDLTLDPKGTALLVANCAGGSVALLPIRPDGRVAEPAAVVQHRGSGVDPVRQKGPYAHGVAITPDGDFAAVADFGLDRIFLHPLDVRRQTLREGDSFAGVVPGGAVRHIAFTPNGKFLYAIDEFDSALTVFRYKHGRLSKTESFSALPPGATVKRGGSEIAVDPKGRFLYVSIRGEENKIAVFALDQRTGHPSPMQFASSGGIMPRHFALSPDGSWLAVANQKSDSIVWMRRDTQSGRLTETPQYSEQVPSPTCIVFVRDR